jgi:hypothetical protein
MESIENSTIDAQAFCVAGVVYLLKASTAALQNTSMSAGVRDVTMP